jgi:hypothetical protein
METPIGLAINKIQKQGNGLIDGYQAGCEMAVLVLIELLPKERQMFVDATVQQRIRSGEPATESAILKYIKEAEQLYRDQHNCMWLFMLEHGLGPKDMENDK